MINKDYFFKSILLALSVFLSAFNSFAQRNVHQDIPEFDLAFEHFELPGGTNGNSVAKIIQDSLGYLWFGSQGGLHRYDGSNIITYTSDPINQNTLNSDYIEDICLDRNGTIWLTHWSGGGLTAFNPDQEKFTRYTNDPDDPESILFGDTGPVLQDSEGAIWVGGRIGLSRLDPSTGKFKRYSHDPEDPHSLSNNEIRGLYVDKAGTLWVATGMAWTLNGEGGLNRYDAETDSFERFLHDPGDSTSISNNKVRAMFEDSQGNFWVGTGGDGLHLFDKTDQTFTRYTHDPEKPGKLSMPFLQGTDSINSNPSKHITSFLEDTQGRIWITAVYGGLNIYDPNLGSTAHFEAGAGEYDLKSNFVWQTFQSDDGTLWVTTAGEGREVYKVRKNEIVFPYKRFVELGDSSSVKRGIIKDPNGSIWIAQSPGSPDDLVMKSSLWKIDRGLEDVEQVPMNPLNTSPTIPAFMGGITLDSSGNIWASTSHGFYIGDLNKNNFRIFIPEIGDPDQWWLVPILQSSSGDIWISFWGQGVVRYDPEKDEYEVFAHDPEDPGSISGPFTWSIYEDKNGNIWMGGGSPSPSTETPLFLDRFDPTSRTFESFIDTTLPYGMVADVVTGPSGNLWFYDWYWGLYRLNPVTRELKKFTSSNSLLPGSRIQSLQVHPNGNIWLATDFELVRLDPMTETFSIYNERHGIVPSVGGTRSGTLSEEGELLFVRWNGIHAFNPNNILDTVALRLPDIRITGFGLLDDNINSGITRQQEGVLTEPIWNTSLIDLENNENTFAFSVACFDFYEPELNTLQFMLEGYDRGWRSDVRNGETPYYINVPPGKYTFRLRGSNGLGIWNTEGIQMAIIVNPPWWQTWWAYTSYGLMFIGGVFGTHKIQRRRLLVKERERAQQKELLQAREIEKAYNKLKETQQQLIHSEKMASLGELTAGIAHEIQNPLNFVNNFSEVNSELIQEMKAEIKKGNLDEARSIANDINENEKKIIYHGKRADSIVKGMLQHSRSNDGKKQPTDLNALADEYVRLAYHGLRAKDKSFNANIETDFDKKLEKVNLIPQEIGRVLLNLLTNAFHAVKERKGSEADGFQPTVWVKTKKTPDGVQISVHDNGGGIPEPLRDKIFQPFFTTKPTGEGTGLGLSMSYDIVTKGHGGKMEMQSEIGKGTEFTVNLPAEK